MYLAGRHAYDKFAVRHIFRNHGAGAGARTAADSDRRHQHCARSYERAVADDGHVFVLSVIVAGNRAGADVHIATDFRIADVAEMTNVCALPDNAVLDFNEIAHCYAVGEFRAGAQATRRADSRTVSRSWRLRNAN